MGRGSVIVLLIFVAGCAAARQVWVHPTATASEQSRDEYECKREALMVPQVGLPPAPPKGGLFTPGFGEGFAQGLYLAGVSRAATREEDARRLHDLCMRVRGYDLRWVSDPPPRSERTPISDPPSTSESTRRGPAPDLCPWGSYWKSGVGCTSIGE